MRGYDISSTPERAVTPLRIMIGVAALAALVSGLSYGFRAPGVAQQPVSTIQQLASPEATAPSEMDDKAFAQMNASLPMQMAEGVVFRVLRESREGREDAVYTAVIEVAEVKFSEVQILMRESLSDRDRQACKSGDPVLNIAGPHGPDNLRVSFIEEDGEAYANMSWRNFICPL